MGSAGEDIMLSPAARVLFPYSVECKSYANFAIYKHYDQAETNSKEYTPILVIKANKKKPLVVIDLDHFMEIINETV